MDEESKARTRRLVSYAGIACVWGAAFLKFRDWQAYLAAVDYWNVADRTHAVALMAYFAFAVAGVNLLINVSKWILGFHEPSTEDWVHVITTRVLSKVKKPASS